MSVPPADKESVLARMGKITDVKVGPMPESLFLKPIRMTFSQDGRKRIWDLMKLHNSVSIIIFNTSRNVLVLVRQFRPPVYFSSAVYVDGENNFDAAKGAAIDWSKHPASNGFTLELCAGILDNPKLTTAEIGRQEILEECGYDVPLANLEYVTCYRHGVGVSGNNSSIYYAEVTDAMKVSAGGGNIEDGELIEVVEMSIPEARNYISQESVNSPGGFLYGIMWFLVNKAAKFC